MVSEGPGATFLAVLTQVQKSLAGLPTLLAGRLLPDLHSKPMTSVPHHPGLSFDYLHDLAQRHFRKRYLEHTQWLVLDYLVL